MNEDWFWRQYVIILNLRLRVHFKEGNLLNKTSTLTVFDFLAQETLSRSHQNDYLCNAWVGKMHVVGCGGAARHPDIIDGTDPFQRCLRSTDLPCFQLKISPGQKILQLHNEWWMAQASDDFHIRFTSYSLSSKCKAHSVVNRRLGTECSLDLETLCTAPSSFLKKKKIL